MKTIKLNTDNVKQQKVWMNLICKMKMRHKI